MQARKNERQICATRMLSIFTIVRYDKALVDTRGFEKHWSLNVPFPSPVTRPNPNTNKIYRLSVQCRQHRQSDYHDRCSTALGRTRRSVISRTKFWVYHRDVILLMLRSLIIISGFACQRSLNICLMIQWHNIFSMSDRLDLCSTFAQMSQSLAKLTTIYTTLLYRSSWL